MAPVVLTMSVEVPDPLVSVAGLNEHAGGSVCAAAPFSVMLLHESVRLALKPCFEELVMLEVADPPGESDAGESADADMANPSTVSCRGVVLTVFPAFPATVSA